MQRLFQEKCAFSSELRMWHMDGYNFLQSNTKFLPVVCKYLLKWHSSIAGCTLTGSRLWTTESMLRMSKNTEKHLCGLVD